VTAHIFVFYFFFKGEAVTFFTNEDVGFLRSTANIMKQVSDCSFFYSGGQPQIMFFLLKLLLFS
jgi:hypothetical protein